MSKYYKVVVNSYFYGFNRYLIPKKPISEVKDYILNNLIIYPSDVLVYEALDFSNGDSDTLVMGINILPTDFRINITSESNDWFSLPQ